MSLPAVHPSRSSGDSLLISVRSDQKRDRTSAKVSAIHRKINAQITGARTIDQIIECFQVNRSDFNGVNISRAFLRIAKISQRAGITKTQKMCLPELVKEAQDKMKTFKPQEIANFVWACLKLKFRDMSLFHFVSKEAQDKMGDFKPQEIANLAWAFASLNFRNESLLEVLSREAQNKMGDFKPQEIANLAWACATLNFRDESLFRLILKEVQDKIIGFKSQEILILAWACAILDLYSVEIKEQMAYHHIDVFHDGNLNQLNQIYLHLKYEKGINSCSWPLKILVAMKKIQRREPVSSKFHHDVATHLKELKLEVQNEVDVNGLIVDIFINDLKLYIEIDGRGHFAYKRTRQPLGRTVFKKRLLNAMGCELKSIPHWEWSALRTSEDKIQYLKGLLSVHLSH